MKLKLRSKPPFVTSEIFNEKLVAVHKIKETHPKQTGVREHVYLRS